MVSKPIQHFKGHKSTNKISYNDIDTVTIAEPNTQTNESIAANSEYGHETSNNNR